MLKLTKKTDYALMAIDYMSGRKATFLANTRNIAETYNIPPELLAKILQKLSRAGLILSQNGPKGGYHLAKDPSDISLGDLIRIIEGPIQITRCVEGDSVCSQEELCTIQSPLRKIEQKIVGYLDDIMIDTITNDTISADSITNDNAADLLPLAVHRTHKR